MIVLAALAASASDPDAVVSHLSPTAAYPQPWPGTGPRCVHEQLALITSLRYALASQRYAVNGVLGDVGSASVRRGTGTFAATLTHYRTTIFGHCVTYAASISGSLSLAPS